MLQPGAAPDLTLAVTHSGAFTRGLPGTYSISVQNVGGGATSGPISVYDTLPPELVFTSVSGINWKCSVTGQNVACTMNMVLVGDSTAPPITLSVMAVGVGTVLNMASVSVAGDADMGNNVSNDVTIIAAPSAEIPTQPPPPTSVPYPAPDLALSATHPVDFTLGQQGTFTLTVTNVGRGPTSGPITVVDVLPDELTVTSSSGPDWTCMFADQNVTCLRTIPLPPGTSTTITLTVKANAVAIVNNTAAASTAGDSNSTNDTAQDVAVILGIPDLTLVKTHVGNFMLGREGTYTLAVSNVGTGATTGPITLIDVLPEELTYVGGTGIDWTCSDSAPIVTCTRFTPLPPFGPPSAITLTVLPARIGIVFNSASVVGDTNTGNNTAVDTTIIVAQ